MFVLAARGCGVRLESRTRRIWLLETLGRNAGETPRDCLGAKPGMKWLDGISLLARSGLPTPPLRSEVGVPASLYLPIDLGCASGVLKDASLTSCHPLDGIGELSLSGEIQTPLQSAGPPSSSLHGSGPPKAA